MTTLDFGFGALEQDFWRVVFLMTRIGAAMLAAPFFGAASIPVTVRVCAAGAVAVFVAVWMPTITAPVALFTLSGVLAVLGEVLDRTDTDEGSTVARVRVPAETLTRFRQSFPQAKKAS